MMNRFELDFALAHAAVLYHRWRENEDDDEVETETLGCALDALGGENAADALESALEVIGYLVDGDPDRIAAAFALSTDGENVEAELHALEATAGEQ